MSSFAGCLLHLTCIVLFVTEGGSGADSLLVERIRLRSHHVYIVVGVLLNRVSQRGTEKDRERLVLTQKTPEEVYHLDWTATLAWTVTTGEELTL